MLLNKKFNKNTLFSIDYLKLRYNCYYHQLKTMITALGQFMSFLVMALYLALPALFLSALISLSVIAAKNTSILERVNYQWGYFLLVFLLIRIQRNAILGSHYQYYLKQILVKTRETKLTTFLLVIIAGNAPLLAPTLLAFLIPNIDTFITQFYFVLFAITVLTLAFFAIKSRYFLLVSLIIYPLAALQLFPLLSDSEASLAHLSLTQTATIINIFWLCIILIEGAITPYFHNTYQNIVKQLHINNQGFCFSGRHYYQFRLTELKNQLASNLIRLLALVTISGLVMIFQIKLHAIATMPIQLIISYFLALLIASYHFDNEAFYKKYHYYLSSLLIPSSTRYLYDNVPIVIITILTLLCLLFVLQFSPLFLLILPLTTLISVVAIHYFPRNFFILPSILTMGLVIYFN